MSEAPTPVVRSSGGEIRLDPRFDPREPLPPSELEIYRAEATKRLGRRRSLQSHLVVYLSVNAMLIGIWKLTTPGGFFWPFFPIAGWGIGLLLHGWSVHTRNNRPAAVEAEMRRLAERSRRRG